MDLLERYSKRVDEKIPESERKWMSWQKQLDEMKEDIREITTRFIGSPMDDQNVHRLRYEIQLYLRMSMHSGKIIDYKVDEVNRNGIRTMIQFPGAIDYRAINMRWN